MKQALIVVDLQNEYLATGKLPLVNIDITVDRAAQVIAHARQQHIPVIHILHEATDLSAPVFNPNSDAVRPIVRVAPTGVEAVIVKNHPNAFLNTELLDLLTRQEVRHVHIMGAMSHMCIDATTRAASDLGFKCTVIEDACTTMNLEFQGLVVPAVQVHATLMAALAFAYAEIKTTAKILAQD